MLTLIKPDKMAKTTFLFTETAGEGRGHCCQRKNRYAHASTKVCPLVIASSWLVKIIQAQKRLSRQTVAA